VSSDASAAADNNARWCDAVCRSHGLATRFAGDLWIAPQGSPRFYPDAVTLAPTASVADLVAHLPRAESVKDSFACLDLEPEGFGLLFDACWIAQASPLLAAPSLLWAPVSDSGELDEWTAAAGLEGILRPELLADPSHRIFAGRDDEDEPIVAGVIANATGRVVGVSNVFTEGPGEEVIWRDLQGVVARAFPGRELVGYEHGDPLAHALGSGFAPIRPLRIWWREIP
jgi:hypothetical protein